eukprot:TRINITY_DN4772_c0_g1_i5.p1 TRINITY_DN4772_c0_g1~~TRINITY_DN4772_c0_g1_i5.p1  ORF type:complete len:215 (+),score=57.24 TRINITY_DN4772_c0_g1_i5:49-693(+)
MSFAPRGVDSEAPLESLSEETLLSCLETVSLEAKRRALYSLLKKEEFLKHAIDRLTYNKQREEKEKESLQPQMLMSDDQQGLFLANERLYELQMQRDIREAAMKSATFSLLLEHAYNSAETDAYAREVCTLDAEKNRLANEMMGIEKNLRQIYARMSQLHIENTRLLEENRALHLQAKGLDAEEDAFNQNPAVAKYFRLYFMCFCYYFAQSSGF